MQLRLILLAGALGTGFAHSPAATTEQLSEPAGWSVEAATGYLLDSKTTAFSVAGGYSFTPRSYGGLEVTGFKADETEIVNALQLDSELKATLAFAIYRYRFPLGPTGRLALLAGAGLGVAWLEMEGNIPAFNVRVSDRSNSDLAGQLFAGLEWRFERRLAVNLRYRHLRLYDSELFGVKADFKDDVVEVGLACRF